MSQACRACYSFHYETSDEGEMAPGRGGGERWRWRGGGFGKNTGGARETRALFSCAAAILPFSSAENPCFAMDTFLNPKPTPRFLQGTTKFSFALRVRVGNGGKGASEFRVDSIRYLVLRFIDITSYRN